MLGFEPRLLWPTEGSQLPHIYDRYEGRDRTYVALIQSQDGMPTTRLVLASESGFEPKPTKTKTLRSTN